MFAGIFVRSVWFLVFVIGSLGEPGSVDNNDSLSGFFVESNVTNSLNVSACSGSFYRDQRITPSYSKVQS